MSANLEHETIDEWDNIIKTLKAMINLVDPNSEKIRIVAATTGLVVLQNKQSNSTIHMRNIKNVIEDTVYFINNDPANNFTTEMVPNETLVRNTH